MFEVFGILFGVIFVLAVVSIIRGAIRIGRIQNKVWDAVEEQLDNPSHRSPTEDPNPLDSRPHNYNCNQCGAALGDNADVSPSGDFKCTYCDKWSNIHS
ncbi:MAG: hypothetical protein P8M30_14215 [Planctomycetaceae bacterium]|jgi:hypothetical protein|nr:hypothetical protein [Planctomycetaceae bacterium]MDG2390459.1 hypothetical protein [Planctomycetaceae bacterium]